MGNLSDGFDINTPPVEAARTWIARSLARDEGIVDSTLTGFLSGVFLALGTNILVGLALSDTWPTQRLSSALFAAGGLCLIIGSAPVLRLGRLADRLRTAPREAGKEVISKITIATRVEDDRLDHFQADVETAVKDLLVEAYRRMRRQTVFLLTLAILFVVAAISVRIVHSIQNAPPPSESKAPQTAAPANLEREMPIPTPPTAAQTPKAIPTDRSDQTKVARAPSCRVGTNHGNARHTKTGRTPVPYRRGFPLLVECRGGAAPRGECASGFGWVRPDRGRWFRVMSHCRESALGFILA